MALCLEDCIALCGLTEAEVLAIAEHERIPGIAAVELGNYLLRDAHGELVLKAMICDDIAVARASGNRERELALRQVVRDFVLQHPKCEARHRAALHCPERRAPL
jgi:hypothetical protein